MIGWKYTTWIFICCIHLRLNFLFWLKICWNGTLLSKKARFVLSVNDPQLFSCGISEGASYSVFWTAMSRAEEFGQNYVRSAATSVDKSENSPQFSYIILRWMRWIWRQKFNAFNAKLCKKWRWIFQLVNASCRWSYIFSVEFSIDLTYLA